MTLSAVNGIDVGALKQTMDDIQDKPGLAGFTFRAINTWVGGTHNRARIKGFYGAGEEHAVRKSELVYDEDEPPVLLGSDKGANPVEYVLVGLSGCLTTSLVAHAAARNITLHAVESELEGDLDVRGFLGMDDSVRNGYSQIRVKFRIDADAPMETIRELVELAKARSPVFDIVTHGVPVKVDVEKI